MFNANPSFLAELEKDPDYRQALVEQAEIAKQSVDALTHRIMPASRASTVTEVQDLDGEVRLANTSFGGHIDEFGSANSPPYAPLRRGVTSAGFRFQEQRK